MRATLTTFSASIRCQERVPSRRFRSNASAAIIAFLLLFSTFAIGLRCFADFDKGLLKSKLHGQSYKRVNQGKDGLFGDFSTLRTYLPTQILIFYTRHRRREEGRGVRRRGGAGAARLNRVNDARPARNSWTRLSPSRYLTHALRPLRFCLTGDTFLHLITVFIGCWVDWRSTDFCCFTVTHVFMR